MIDEPAGAAEALAAFRRAASDPDPIFALSEGFAIVLRSHGVGMLTPETRQQITDELWRAEEAAQVPEAFGAARLNMGAVALFTLCIAWTEPTGSPARAAADVRLARLIVRTIANDLDTICARIEFDRAGGHLDQVFSATLNPRPNVVH